MEIKSKGKALKWIAIVFGILVLLAIIGNVGSSPPVASEPNITATQGTVQSSPTSSPVKTPVKKATAPPQSSPVPTPTPVSPPQTPASWHAVSIFTGSGASNTSPFTIQGSQWRIQWTATVDNNSYCQQYGCYFTVMLYLPGGESYEDYIESKINTTKSDSSYFYKPGQYYLHIPATNVTSWTLTVEDYY